MKPKRGLQRAQNLIDGRVARFDLQSIGGAGDADFGACRLRQAKANGLYGQNRNERQREPAVPENRNGDRTASPSLIHG